MKTFITYISRQKGEGLLGGIYRADSNDRLQMNTAVHFPMVTMLHGYVEQDEEVRVLILYGEDNMEYESNRKVLEADIQALQKEKPFRYTLVPVAISEEETALEHLKAFTKLLELIEDGDELYVCCTYGSKPTPIVEMMAINTAYRLKKDVSIGCLIYGRVEHNKDPKKFYVYDITSLFYMIQIVSQLENNRISNPEDAIRAILEPGE